MPIINNDNIDTRSPKPTDQRQGKFVAGVWQPFDSVADANTRITYRYKTLTVPILVGGEIKDYWYRDGITDVDLVEKPRGGGGVYTGNATLL
jgi:hypothetical protein